MLSPFPVVFWLQDVANGNFSFSNMAATHRAVEVSFFPVSDSQASLVALGSAALRSGERVFFPTRFDEKFLQESASLLLRFLTKKFG